MFLHAFFLSFHLSADLGQCEDVSEKERAIDRGDRAARRTDVPNDSTVFHLAQRVKNRTHALAIQSVLHDAGLPLR